MGAANQENTGRGHACSSDQKENRIQAEYMCVFIRSEGEENTGKGHVCIHQIMRRTEYRQRTCVCSPDQEEKRIQAEAMCVFTSSGGGPVETSSGRSIRDLGFILRQSNKKE